MSIYSFTGHRPLKLGGYSMVIEGRLISFAETVLTRLPEKFGPIDHCVVGMALGWDMAVAQACVLKDIPFIAAIPCATQACMWPNASQDLWRYLLERATSVVTIAPHYSPRAMQARNEWMVDNSTHLIALWDGSTGGTGNCVAYAKQQKRSVVNCWSRWLEIQS